MQSTIGFIICVLLVITGAWKMLIGDLTNGMLLLLMSVLIGGFENISSRLDKIENRFKKLRKKEKEK